MTQGAAVSNSSPLIALERIGELDLLRQIFGQIVVPPAVVAEVGPSFSLPPWITEQGLTQPVASRVLSASLGPGEREAICLAVESNAQWLLLDDRPARRLAGSIGLPIIGTLGVLLAAKRRGLVTEVRPRLDALINQGFFIAPALYAQVLAQAGEPP